MFSGVTLFTGTQATVTVRSASSAHGIVFRRVDLPRSQPIPADVAHVVPEARRTVLSADPRDPAAASVQTVEHLLSALAGLGITDAQIDVNGPEIPVLDGSAKEFVEGVARAGIAELQGKCRVVRVTKSLRIEERGGEIEALPSEEPGLSLEYHLDYGAGSPLPTQSCTIRVPMGGVVQGYEKEIAPARTFCLLEEAQAMRKMGLFKHLEPSQMLVIGPEGPIENTYRFPDEPARHKLLDLLGDISLCGRAVQGRIVAHRSGHSLNHLMAKALMEIL